MSKDINVTDGTVLETLNNKVDLDGGNYKGSPLEEYIHEHCGGSGLQLFDTILKDHMLSYEESKGLALQGTYVYKTAIAGSRYGYPDFYNKCLEEYTSSIPATNKRWLQSNVTIVGQPKDRRGEVSAFSATDYLRIPESIPFTTAGSFELVVCFTPQSTGSPQNIFRDVSANYTSGIQLESDNTLKIALNRSTSNTYFMDFTSTEVFNIGTKYWVKVSCKDNNYTIHYSTDGINYILLHSVASNHRLLTQAYVLGTSTQSSYQYPFQGSIDLTECYLDIDDNRWWTGADTLQYEYRKNSNGHSFYDISQKNKIDELFNLTGSAWMYGIDQENERIFLPRNNRFEQMTGDVLEVGQIVEAGLPNITGHFQASSYSNSDKVAGAFSLGSQVDCPTGGNNGGRIFTFDASRSNPIYDNSDTVQPPAVKKLLYICVGNTVSENAVTDVVDVTTTENDTTPLFTGLYFDFTPNNVSWLKAGQQKQSGGVYTTCYNELVNELTNPKYSLKVIETKDMIAGVDYSEYWKVNQTNMTFTTPTKISSRSYEDIAPVVGNGMTLGMTNGTKNAGFVGISGPGMGYGAGAYGVTVGTSTGNVGTSPSGSALGVTTDPTKSGIEAHLVENTRAQLYFKVANAVQNLELLDAGQVLEAVANHASQVHIIETYVNGTSGYLTYSNGYHEEWGAITQNSGFTHTVTFLKQFKDTNYQVYVCTNYTTKGSSGTDYFYNKTVSSCGFVVQNVTGTANWRACGYIA